jgi:chromate transporter
MSSDPAEVRARPQSPSDLFISFTLLALQGFGGVLAVVQRELVDRKRWMTQEEFIEDWAVAQIMPGPNVVNIALMIGTRYFGMRGALAALAGMLTVPLIVIMLLALAYSHLADNPLVLGALRGMGAVAAGLIVATGLKLLAALKNNPLGRPICIGFVIACFAGVAVLRWPLAYVLPALGIPACILAYRRIGR